MDSNPGPPPATLLPAHEIAAAAAALGIETSYWDMWGQPMFDIKDPAGVMLEVTACRKAHPTKYIKVLAFDSRKGFETVRMSFIVNRPAEEPGFDLVRAEGPGRQINYTMRSYASAKPAGQRY